MALLTQHRDSQNILHWALLISSLTHVIAIYLIPKIEFTPEVEPKILTVEIAPPAPPQAKPAPPEQKPAEPPKPQAKQEPIKKTPQPVEPLPQKQSEPVTEKTPETKPVTEPPPSNIMAVAPKQETPTPAPVVVPPPPPEPPKPVAPQIDYDALSNQYARLISREVAKYKQYPKIAQMRNWQGETIVQILVDANGKVLDRKIQTSSGYEVLDKQALKMVVEAVLPLPPEALRSKPISILIPISFKLE